MNTLKIENLTKKYKKNIVLDNINIEFKEKTIYGLFGRNGVGKSTLIKIINQLNFPNSGTITIAGKKLDKDIDALSNIYTAHTENNFPKSMKISKIFKITKEFYPSFDLDNALKHAELFNLPMKSKVAKLSTGYTSIVKNIIALNINLPFVIYDEPILGLDANFRDLFYKLLLESYEKNPHTIIITSHFIDEIANILENIVIIKDGKIIVDDSVENISANTYTITGPKDSVDEFIKDKQLIGSETLANLKVAYVLGKLPEESLPTNLSVSLINLEKFFIKITD